MVRLRRSGHTERLGQLIALTTNAPAFATTESLAFIASSDAIVHVIGGGIDDGGGGHGGVVAIAGRGGAMDGRLWLRRNSREPRSNRSNRRPWEQ
jgi:hypothetical protein